MSTRIKLPQMILVCEKAIKYNLVFWIIFCLSGCAIHKEFPFICFEKPCVKNQYGRFGKKIKGNIYVLKKKKKKKDVLKKKADTEKYKEADTDDFEGDEGLRVQYSKYLMVFSFKNYPSDTIMISHSSYHKDIMEAGKSEIEHLVRKIGVKNFLKVVITPVRLDELNKTEDLAIKLRRKKIIRKYLMENGLAHKQIIFTSE